MEISVNKDGEDLGPFSLEDLQAQLADGSLSLEDYAWFEGCEDWVYVANVPGLQEGSAPKQDGVYLEQNEQQKGPFPVAQLQGMVNQGVVPIDTPAWMEGWGDWGTVEDVPGIKKPRVKVSGSANPLARLTATGKEKKDDKEKKDVDGSEDGSKKKGVRARRKKGRGKENKTLKQKLIPIIAAVVILIVLAVGGLFVYSKFFVDEEDDDGGGGIFSTIKKTVKDDEPPPTDPWDLADWRKKRQK
jgi:hypothetical protein